MSTKGISGLGYGAGIEDDMLPGPRIDPSTGRPFGDATFRIGEVSTVPSTPVTAQRSYFEDLVQKGGPTPSRSYFGDVNKKSTQERILEIGVVPEEDFPTNTSKGEAFADPFTDRIWPSADDIGLPLPPNVPQSTTPTAEMVEMMRASGPFSTLKEDPESLRYKEAARLLSYANRSRPVPVSQSIPIPKLRPEGIGTSNIPIPRLRPDGIGTSLPYEGSEPPTDEDITGQGGSPSQEDAAPSQDFTVTPEAEAAQEAARIKAERARRAGGAALNLFAPPFGTIIGQGIKFADAQMQKLVDRYQSSGIEERRVLEDKYPNLIPRAQAMGIQSYYGMDKYRDWADRAGLRAPPSREGGNENSGIEAIAPRPPRDGEPSPRPDTSSGSRPDIYYMWDLGIKIPSPSDPNYTQYQAYLAERLAAQ
jgi:hypothetical protein